MKKTFRTFTLLLLAVLILFTSCNDKLQKMDEGSVNEYIYPYLKFEKTEDDKSVSAVVIAGAKIQNLKIPAEVTLEGTGKVVVEFKGFENPADAESLKKIELPSTVDKIADDALSHATNLESIEQKGENTTLKWPKMPVLMKDGMHGMWKAGDKYIKEGDLIDPKYPKAEPVWEKHELKHNAGIPSTCKEQGTAEYWYCPVCDNSFKSEKAELTSIIKDKSELVLPLAPHTLSYRKGRAPSCVDAGKADSWFCIECKKVFKDENALQEVLDEKELEIPALGHSMVAVDGKAATCTENGYASHYSCSRCGYLASDADGKNHVEFDDLIIPMKNHKNPDGSSAVIYKAGKAATCEEGGTHEYWYCSLCNRKYKDESLTSYYEGSEFIIDPLGHDFSNEWKSDIENHWHECTHDSSHITDKGAHVWSEYVIKKEPTYDENGYKERYCTICNRIDRADIPADAHEFTIATVIPPTCFKEGYTRLDCSKHANCQKWIIKEGSRVAPLNHKNKAYNPAVSPTCTADGKKEYWYCADCDKNHEQFKYYSDAACKNGVADLSALVEEALGHEWSNDYVNTDPDKHWKECTRPGCNAITEEATHEYKELKNTLISSADCQHYAVYKLSCICGRDHATETWEDVNGGYGKHINNAVAEQDSTCTEIGYEAHYKCSKCGKLFRDLEGTQLVEKKDLEIPKKAHTTEKVEKKPASCTVDGMEAHFKCTVCGNLFRDAEGKQPVTESDLVIKHEGHKHGSYENVPDGNGHRHKCSVCGELYGDIIPHAESGNYESAGASGHYRTCKDCGAAYGDLIGHNMDWRKINDDYHHHICTDCSYETPNSKENHQWKVYGVNEFACEKCGATKKSESSGGGFDVQEENYDPEGHIEIIETAGNRYHFKFFNENAEACPDESLTFTWTIDGNVEKEGKGSEFIEFECIVSGKRSYLIDCMFIHENGAGGSHSISVTGNGN